MAMYATAVELAGFKKQDLDTYAATQALTLATGEFVRVADTPFAVTSATWSTSGDGCTAIELPHTPLVAVSAVRVNGAPITGWTLRLGVIYRTAGFGTRHAWPPDQVDVDLTYGYAAVPDDVKLAVLELAAGLYEPPPVAISETIDDHTVRYDPAKTINPSGRPWREVAESYRGLLIA